MRILIVCTGNTCRSPMAEAILRDIAGGIPALTGLQVESAGSGAANGMSATREAIESMLVRGLDLAGHRSRRLTDEIVAAADVVLTMEESHCASVAKIRTGTGKRVATLGSFVGTNEEVDDPVGKGQAAYDACADQLGRLLRFAAARLVEAEPRNFAAVESRLPGRLFRVARPGRGIHRPDDRPVSEEAIYAWVHGVADRLVEAGMPEPLDVDYVCLLGRKPGGLDEIADFYPARRADDETQPDLPTFEEMLNQAGNGRIRFTVHHQPTVDHEDISMQRLDEIRAVLRRLLGEGRTVLIGCSLGKTRTEAVLGDLEWT